MKKTIFTLAVITIFMSGSLLTSCQSTAQKERVAQDKVDNAQENLDVAKYNADMVDQKVATAEQFKTYKLETELKIKNNEVKIAEIKLKIRKSGAAFDEGFANKIDSLELKNKNMKSRIDNYEKSHSDWETFKREFNHDMDELGNAVKDLGVKNKQ